MPSMLSKRGSTLVIGAGAAGLAAARNLHEAGQTVTILEGRDRIGGRAYTNRDVIPGFPLEMGAEFIHGESAVTHELVRQAGFHTLPVVRMDNLWWAEGENPAKHHNVLPSEIKKVIEGILKDYDDLATSAPPHDLSLADYLREQGWGEDALQTADVLLAQTCCARLDSLSCDDLIHEAQVDHAGYDESRIQEGYAALFEWYSRDLNILLNTRVREIEWGTAGVTVHTDNGYYQADSCIVTIPVALLQRGVIRFSPALSKAKQEAIAAFKVEPATKLIYQFRTRFWDENLTFMAHTGLAARWWTPGYGHEDNTILCAFITADRANKIDRMSESDALIIGLQELSTLLKVSIQFLQENCVVRKRVTWALDEFALGGYAHVPVGKSGIREALAAPESDILFFAGEATAYDTNPQTVHGAIESGWRAAQERLNSL